jgi:hypothetical protein
VNFFAPALVVLEQAYSNGMVMSKKVCKLVKQKLPKEDLDSYIQAILPAKYVCKKCGRTACKEDYLCKPIKMNSK